MIGDILKQLRTKKRLTSEELCAKIGVKGGSYRNYERNDRKPDYDTLVKLADFYGVTTDYLLGRETMSEKDDLSSFVKHTNVKDLEEILIRRYLELSDDQREAVLDFMRRAIQEEAGRRGIVLHHNSTETVQEAARGSNLPNATGLATYTAEQLQRLDNAPDVDPDL